MLMVYYASGAGDSEGKTSWTAKPELADYVSFYGFMFYFLNALKAGVSPSQRQRPNQSQTSPVDVGDDESGKTHTTLDIILSGYSYGSMIASHVPTVDTVLKLFQEAPKDSFAAAARSRAEQCSAHCNDYTQAAPRPQTPELPRPGSSPRSPLPVVLGQSPASPKGRKTSLEGVRRSIDQAKRKISFGSRSSDVGSREPRRDTMAKLEIPTPRISYLLVSPILPPISQFLTMFSKISLSSNASSGTSAQGTPIPSPVPEQQLCAHPTLAIYGDNDTFTPAHKLEKWCDDIANMAESKFQHREIEDAGHFWHEHGARTQMKATIRTWIDRLHRDNENI